MKVNAHHKTADDYTSQGNVLIDGMHDIVDRIVVILGCVVVGLVGVVWVSCKERVSEYARIQKFRRKL